MIILVFLSPFFIALAWVLYVDSSNITMIEEFYKKNSCQNIYNYKSRYKAICDEKVVIIKNQFSIDFSENVYIKYSDIKDIKKENSKILIKTDSLDENLYFKESIDSEVFYKELEKRVK